MAKQWQIQLRGKVFGPFSEAKLRHLATTGKINRKTPIRSDENSIWIVAERFSGLFTDTENIDPILSDDDDKFSAADTPSGISQYISRSGEQTGPFSSAQLKTFVRDKSLRPSDLLWKQGQEGWEAASTFRNLFPESIPQQIPPLPKSLPPQPAATQSHDRRKPCPLCGELIAESAIKCRYCSSMIGFADGSAAKAPSPISKPMISPSDPPKDPIIVAMLSGCCIAGLGHMVLGQVVKGVVCLIGSVVLGAATHGISILVTWPLMGVDAYMVARKLKSGRAVTEWECFPT